MTETDPLEPPPGHYCGVDARCVCGHTLLAHFLVADAGQRACGRDRSNTRELHCRQFVKAGEPV